MFTKGFEKGLLVLLQKVLEHQKERTLAQKIMDICIDI